jgi:uncharacterized RDD family membrane protein YckC
MPYDLPPLASRWKRLGGVLIDGAIMFCAVIPLVWLFVNIDLLAEDQEMSLAWDIVISVLMWGIFLMLNGYLLAKYGQTIGKRIVGTRIVDYRTNKLVPLAKIFFWRYFAMGLAGDVPYVGVLIGLADPLFIFYDDKRCIHDLIAGTKVVDARFMDYDNAAQVEECLIVNYEDDTDDSTHES